MTRKRRVGWVLSAIGIVLMFITGLMEREPLSIEQLIWILSGFIFGTGLCLLLFPKLFQRYEWVGDIEVSKEAIEKFLKQQKKKEGRE